jgi:hypothetical protein
MNMILFGIILSIVWIWIFIEIENAPLYTPKGIEYKEYFTIFGIKVSKNFRKPKKQ